MEGVQTIGVDEGILGNNKWSPRMTCAYRAHALPAGNGLLDNLLHFVFGAGLAEACRLARDRLSPIVKDVVWSASSYAHTPSRLLPETHRTGKSLFAKKSPAD
jgi:hypothetical protein